MPQVGRNERCPCGSGKKYKACCLSREQAAREAPRALEELSSKIAAIDAQLEDSSRRMAEKVDELLRARRLPDAEKIAVTLAATASHLAVSVEPRAKVLLAKGERAAAAAVYREAASSKELKVDDAQRAAWRAEADGLDR
jgi:hypothetical protein